MIQDAGYAADSCGDLPGIGCPVGDLNPIFLQAYNQGELKKFDPALSRKPRWLVFNKVDLVDVARRQQVAAEFRRRLRSKSPMFLISAATGEGCRELMAAVHRHLSERSTADSGASAGLKRRRAGGGDPL